MINVSLEALANDGRPPAHVLGHEIIHYLKHARILNPQEWQTLEVAADREGWVNEFDIAEKYPDLDYASQVEEAVAEKFAEYLTPMFIPENSGWKPDQVSIFGKIKKWIRALAGALGAHGFYKPSDVFQDIFNGAYANREAQFELTDTNIAGTKEIRMPSWDKADAEIKKANKDAGQVRFLPDITVFQRWISTPKQIAHLDTTKLFSQFWWTSKQMKQYFNKIISSSTEGLETYGKAIRDAGQRQTLREVMEIAQMSEVPENDVQIVEEADRIVFVNGPNAGQGKDSTVKPNQVIELTGETLAAYKSVQEVMSDVLHELINSHIEGNIDQFVEWWKTIDPEPGSQGIHSSDLINADEPGELGHALAHLGWDYVVENGVRREVPEAASGFDPLTGLDDQMRPITGWLTLLDYLEETANNKIASIQEEYDNTIAAHETTEDVEAKAALKERETALEKQMSDLISAWDDGLALLRNNMEGYEKFAQNRHYAPQMRFGQYYFTLRDPDTNEVVWYGQVEVNPFAKSTKGKTEVEQAINNAVAEVKKQHPNLTDAVLLEGDYGDNNLDSIRQDLKTAQSMDYIRNNARINTIDSALESMSVNAIQSGPLNSRGTNDYADSQGIFEDIAEVEHKEHLASLRDNAIGLRRDILNDLVGSSIFKTRSAGFAKQLWQPRKHTPGYDVNYERAIATYLTGAARYASKMRYQPSLERQLNKIENSNVKRMSNYANEYYDYIMNPVEEHRFLRSAGFMWWLGGNMSSAALQTVSAFNFATPTLIGYTGMNPAKAAAETARSMKDATKLLEFPFMRQDKRYNDMFLNLKDEALPKDFKAVIDNKNNPHYEDLMQALHDGVLKNFSVLEEQGMSPHVRRMRIVAGEGVGSKLETAAGGLSTMLATPFNTMETYTRFMVYTMSHRAARDPKYRAKIADSLKHDGVFQVMVGDKKPLTEFTPHEFASYMVESNMGVFGKDNRSKFMRGHLAPVFQFQSYPLMMLELLSRSFRRHGAAGRKALVYMMLASLMLGGVAGLPGVDDIEDWADWIDTKITGTDPMYRAEFRNMLYDMTDGSKFYTDLFEFGLPGALGFDVQRRVNLQVPGMDILKASIGIAGDADDLLGLPGTTWISGTKSFGTLASQGRWNEAVPYALPAFARNAMQAMYVYPQEGVRSQRGQSLMTPEEYNDLSIMRRMGKALGFTPIDIRHERDIAFQTTRINTRVRPKQDRFVARMSDAYIQLIRANQVNDNVAAGEAQEALVRLIELARQHNDQVYANSQPTSYLLPIQSMVQSATERAVQAINPYAKLRRLNTRARKEGLELMERSNSNK
jgi:hypothetical protein